jgi:two-component system chemotaxis sensor kinase CheA
MLSATEKGIDGGLLRIPADKIGRLMDLIGELSLGVSATVQAAQEVQAPDRDLTAFEAASHHLTTLMRDVQDAASELRLVEVDDVFRRLRRMIREIERDTDKPINLVIEGEDTRIDKLVADRLYEPLLHVVRNAADHGLELPSQREAAGKPPAGEITLSAAQLGSEVTITVADDGRGLDYDRILAKARERGLIAASERPAPEALWPVIFQPGFSTAESVTKLSGRGVGMDVLNTALTAMRGRVSIQSTAGKGSCISLHIPLSLAFLDCIILRHGPRLFAVAIDTIEEILSPTPDQIQRISATGSSRVLRQRNRTVPIITMPRPEAAKEPDDFILVKVATSHGPVALLADEVIDRQQVVMKPLQGRLEALTASWGLALLNTGEVATVLDCERLSLRGGA